MERVRIGPYQIERELGAGAMGTVYEARDPGGRRVAVKVVHPHLLKLRGLRERFFREAELGARIQHPNVVRTLDSGEHDGKPYLVLEFVVGQTLADLGEELGQVPESLCRHIGLAMASGLAALHEHEIVHRDVKPENVLITPEHDVRLMDLGLARSADGLDRMTRTGQFVGSPAYAPPEQFVGVRDLDARSDLYSLGVTLYELVTGQRPFVARSLEALAPKVLKEPPPKPTSHAASVSPFFEALLLTLLAKEPARRFASATELAEILQQGEASPWWCLEATRIEHFDATPLPRVDVARELTFLGRDREVTALLAAFDAARGGDGQVVLLEGEEGVGKTRLVDELLRRAGADRSDVHVLLGTFPPGGAATPASAFVDAFARPLGIGGAARHLHAAPALAAPYEAMLRGDAPPDGVDALSTDSLKSVHAHLTRSLAMEKPTLLVVEDLHFAPVAGLALFASLAMAVSGHRVLLVGTTRGSLSREWVGELVRRDVVRHLELERLDDAVVERILSPIVGSSLDAERLAAAIIEAADGNPFILLEVVRSLRESGVLLRAEDGSWITVSRVDEVAIPGSVRALLEARLERLTAEERELLECAACRGAEFDGRIVADALGMRSLPALRTLARIEKEHGLIRSVGGRFAFDQHAIQELLEESLPAALREELHAALADALEASAGAAAAEPSGVDGALCVDLCHHLLEGGRGPRALRYLAAAQAHLGRTHQHARLVELGERALATPGLLSGLPRVECLLRGASALDLLGEREPQEAAAREAVAVADEVGDEEWRGAAAAAVARVLWRTGRAAEAEPVARRVLEIARAAGDVSREADAAGNLGNVFKSLGRADEAQEQYERQMAIAAETGNPSFEGRACGSLGNLAFARGDFAEAERCYARSLRLAHELGDAMGESSAHGNLGNALYSTGRFDQAREHVERQLSIVRRVGDRGGEARAIGALAIVAKAQGRLEDAVALLERSLALHRETESPIGEASGLANFGSTLTELGDLAGARAALDAGIEVSRTIGARYPEGFSVLRLATVHGHEGDLDSAVDLARRAVALRREIGHADGVAAAQLELGELLVRAGDAESARPALEEALAWCRAHGRSGDVARALALLATLPGADVAERAAALAAIDSVEASVPLAWLAFRLTRDRSRLDQAKRLLDAMLETVSEERRDAVCRNLHTNREVLAAWAAGTHDSLGESEIATRLE